MIELFPNVPGYVREQAKFWVDLALQQKNPFEGAKMISKYVDSCLTEEDKEFVNFYFNLRLEQIRNENNND